MKPLILSNEKNNFEVLRLRKDLKGSLELHNFPYSVSVYDESYSIAHFLTIDDFKKYKSETPKGTKFVLSLLYCEEDYDGKTLKFNHDKNYNVSRFDVDVINKVDKVLTPSKKTKQQLILSGVTAPIEVLSPGINVTKYSVKNTYTRNIAYRYLKCSEEYSFVTTVLNYEDTEAFYRLQKLASRFPKIKFVGIFDSRGVGREIKKIIKKSPANLQFPGVLDEEVYLSLIFNSKAFLFINSNPGNIFQSLEAMASETQILALNSAVYPDIVIDKENGYVYNDFDSLAEGFAKLMNNELNLTIQKAKEFANANSLKNIGEKLIEIYRGL